MRNLKRALSLALASVMLLGMMVVGTSAASYPDVDENDNVEAIEVLNAVNVMIGRQGNFEPDEAVNRHEMAVIMAKLVLGVDTADNYVGSHPFTDVVPWADKYVAACYENGLVAGTSATTYGGGNPLTAVQAAAMMLRALGYKDLSVGAQDWRAPVTAMANQIRLFNGVASNPSERLNRNQVAQLALNTLKSPIVNLKDNTISWSNDEGQVIMTGGSREYIVLSSREAYARAINRVESAGTSASQIGGWTVELGEHLYNGKLQLRDTTDVFGRPARHWEYDGKVIGDYAKEELLVKDYVGKVTGKDLYDLLTSDVLDDYELIVHVDGVDEPKIVDAVKADPNRNTSIVFDKVDLNRNNKAAVGATGTGVQTEVYVDHIEHEIYVAVINTYLAIADKDYDTKKEETALTIYGVAQETASKEYVKLKGDKESYKLGVEEFAITADMAKDDSFLVTLADQEIQTIVPAEVISGATLSAFKLDDHVVSGGTDYNYTTTATYKEGDLNVYTGDGKENLKDRTYDIYLDAYGNLIGLKEIDAKKNYVFISGLDRNGSNLVNRIATANGVFLDGTSETIQINMTKSTWNDVVYTDQNTEGEALLNTWCTYTKNGDIYTVKEVFSAGSSTNLTGAKAATSQFHQTGTTTGREADKEFEINLKNLRLDGGGTAADGFRYVYGDSDSVYLTSELDELRWTDGNGNIAIVTGAETVSTGIIDTSITVWDIKGAADTAEDSKVKGEIPYKASNVAHGVYTLYDKDGIIIAAMAVGEGSASKDLVYVHTSELDLESDNGNSSRAAGDGLWTWTRRVIRDGQEVTLTEVGDASEELEFMEQYKWYEVREDGNGDVIKVTRADIALGNTGRDRFVEKYNEINDTVELDNVSTVLYQTEGGPNANQNDGFGVTKDEILVVKGNNTLAVNTKEGSGIHFRNDVNVVLQYWNRNTKEIDIMAGEGVDDLKDMVDIVNDITKNTDRYNDGVKKTYYVSALIENGLATDIVIFDSYNTYSVNRPTTPTGNARLVWNDVNKDDQYWNLIIPASEYKANMTTAEIAGWLAQAGCSEISKTRVGWNFVRNGMTYTDQAIVVIPSATYSVTVSAGANGTASANVTYAEAGDVVTVTTAPAAGYVVDTVTTVPAATVTGSGNTYKFTMPAASVVVNVTFKATAVVTEKYTVTFDSKLTSENSEVFANGTKISNGTQVDKDAVITVNPAAALNVTKDDTAKTITVAPKPDFTWSKTFGMWMGVNEQGNLITVPFDATAIAASMFRMARAAEIPTGKVDTSVPGWFGQVSRDYGATYTISVGSVVWTGKITAGSTAWNLTSGDAAAAKAAIMLIDTAEVVKTEAKPVDPIPSTDRKAYPVQATVTLDAGKRTVEFKADFEAGKTTRSLTKEEMAAAIGREGYVLTASNIDLLNNKIKATLNGTEVEITINTTNATIKGSVLELKATQELFQVKYPGKTLYLPTGSVDLDGVTAGVKYLMPKTQLQGVAASAIKVGEYTHKANGVYVATADIEFVEGVKVYVATNANVTASGTKLTVSDGAVSPKKATIEMVINVPGVQDKDKFQFANDLLQKGTVLSLVQSSTASETDALVDEVFSLVKNNGTPVEYTVAEAGKLPTMADVVVDSVNTANQAVAYKGNFTLDFALGTAPANVNTVTLDGVAMTPGTTANTYVAYLDKDLRDCVIIAENRYGQRTAVTPTKGGSYPLDGKITYTFSATDAVDQWGTAEQKRTVNLYTAYEVYGPATSGSYGSIYANKTDALTVANETYAISPDTAITSAKKEYVKTTESKDFYLVTKANDRYVWDKTGDSANFASADSLGRHLPDSGNRVWKVTVDKALNKSFITDVGSETAKLGLTVTDTNGQIVVNAASGVALNTKVDFALDSTVGMDFKATTKKAGIASIAIQKVDASNGREYLIKVDKDDATKINVILVKGTAVSNSGVTTIAELRVTLTTGDTVDVKLTAGT